MIKYLSFFFLLMSYAGAIEKPEPLLDDNDKEEEVLILKIYDKSIEVPKIVYSLKQKNSSSTLHRLAKNKWETPAKLSTHQAEELKTQFLHSVFKIKYDKEESKNPDCVIKYQLIIFSDIAIVCYQDDKSIRLASHIESILRNKLKNVP